MDPLLRIHPDHRFSTLEEAERERDRRIASHHKALRDSRDTEPITGRTVPDNITFIVFTAKRYPGEYIVGIDKLPGT